jgi:hypothetical protein
MCLPYCILALANRITKNVMRKALLHLTATAFLLLSVGECFAFEQFQSQSATAANCCASMRCRPSVGGHDCCKQMTGDSELQYLGQQKVALRVPACQISLNALNAPLPIAYTYTCAFGEAAGLGPHQHAPPDLYTQFHSYLI